MSVYGGCFIRTAQRVSITAVAIPAAVCDSSSLSYSRTMFKQPIKTTSKSIGSILDLFKGYNAQNFDGLLASFCAEEQEARHRFKENMADLEAKRSEVLQNKKNINQLCMHS